jgi:parallel beta-helix repeat protein
LLFALPLINREKSVKASPTTWTVDDNGPADFDNIQEAINNASSGDTVFVHIGTYYEHVVINKTITLVGEDNNFTIIDGYETNNVIYIRANNVTVKGFTVRKSGMYLYSGILVDHSMGTVIIDNKIIYNYEGISLLYSSGNVVCGNTISSNFDEGISLLYSSGNVVCGNTISSNSDGIYLDYSGNNVVSGNVLLHNNFAGMNLYHSSNNMIYGNTISSNYPGISLALLSSNNTIYHNNFNNTVQAWSESTNVWNYGDEGNYWSDYTKQDINNDGIGDTPYAIDAVNEDNYPLMGTFSEFSITLERETYSVTVISNSTISVFSFQIGAETGNKIIHFNATGEDSTLGFCRVKIPTKLMNYPHIVLVDSEEILPTVLNVSNEAYAYLYFAYLHKNHTITIISSKTLALYFELLDGYLKLQKDLYDLNETYYALLENYNILLSNYTQLQISFGELNNSYQMLSGLNKTYYELLDNYLKLQKTYYALSGNYTILLYNYSQLQTSFHGLNNSYFEHLLDYSVLLGNYNILLYNYTQLQVSFHGLNDSYLEHLLDYSEQMQNIRNLTYILVALTAIFIITTIYLSKREHTNVITKIKAIEEE